jgi:hypothetical protein
MMSSVAFRAQGAGFLLWSASNLFRAVDRATKENLGKFQENSKRLEKY